VLFQVLTRLGEGHRREPEVRRELELYSRLEAPNHVYGVDLGGSLFQAELESASQREVALVRKIDAHDHHETL
jgi:hypothetical protein